MLATFSALVCALTLALAGITGVISQPEVGAVGGQQLLVNLDLKRTGKNEGLYYGELVIDAERPFKMLVCTSCKETWVISKNLRRKCIARYRLAMPDADGAYSGFYFSLTYCTAGRVQIASKTLEKATIGVVVKFQSLEKFEIFNLDGTLGLSSSPQRWDISNPINQLHSNGSITSRIASLYLSQKPSLQDNEVAGVLTLGGLNCSYFEGNVSYVPMIQEAMSYKISWHLKVENVHLDWSRVVGEDRPSEVITNYKPPPNAATTRVYLDSSTPYFVGYWRHLDRYLIGFMGAKRFGLAGNYVFADCRLDNKPDFVFQLADANSTSSSSSSSSSSSNDRLSIRLRPKDYVIEHEHSNRRRYCLAAFLADEDNSWTLGTQFMRNYYTVFDYGRGRVGFARPSGDVR